MFLLEHLISEIDRTYQLHENTWKVLSVVPGKLKALKRC